MNIIIITTNFRRYNQNYQRYQIIRFQFVGFAECGRNEECARISVKRHININIINIIVINAEERS